MNIESLLRKWWVWLILIILVLLLLVSLLTSRFFNPLLQDKLESMVQEETKGMYSLQLHGLDASLLSGRIAADSIRLIPDFQVWEQKNEAFRSDSGSVDVPPRTLISFKTKALKITGLNFIGILRDKPLDINRLRLVQPELQITEMRPDTTEEHEPLHESLEGVTSNMEIKHIEVEDATLRIRQGQYAESDRISLDSLSIRVRDLRLDSTSFQDEDRAYYAKRMELESGKASFLLPDGSYRIEAGALKANTEDGTLNIGNLELVPLLKNNEQARRKGSAATTLKVEVPEINASGVDYRLHSRYNNLAAASIVIESPSLSAYMDRKNFPQKGEKPLPHDLVLDLKTGLDIRKIEVKGMHIRYEELAPEAVETGVINFENLYATITNITNDENKMSADSPAVVDAKASVNGDAPLAVTIRLNLIDPDAYHTIKGTAGPADPATLNPILEPTTFISVKEGKLQKSDFSIELYRNKASGNLNVRYNDFKVDVLTKDEDTRQSLGKKVLSKIANKIVVTSDNPEEGESLRPGEIEVVRARTRSVFNYWKDCLVSGFRSAAGLEGIGDDLQDAGR